MQRHGFIRTELELKTLILYVLRRAGEPVAFHDLTDMVLCDDAIDYFEYINCLNDLVRTEHVHREQHNDDEMHFISQKGRRNLNICVGSLPVSVRDRADNSVDRIMRTVRRRGSVEASTITRENGELCVRCKLRDDSGEILSLELAVLTQEQARTFTRNFERNAESIYNVLLAAMLEDPS